MLETLREYLALEANPPPVSPSAENPLILDREFREILRRFTRECELKARIFLRAAKSHRLSRYLRVEIEDILRVLSSVSRETLEALERYKVEAAPALERYIECSSEVNSISFVGDDNAQARMNKQNDIFIATLKFYMQTLRHINFSRLSRKINEYLLQQSAQPVQTAIPDISRADAPDDRTYSGFNYMYDRKQLIKSYINKYQGTCDAPGVTSLLIEQVRNALHRYRLIQEGETNEEKYRAVTINHVKTILRETKDGSKHVDNASYILNQVRGYRTIFIEHLEHNILNDFAQFINAGAEILEKNRAQNKRKNLFCLNYILYHLLRRRGLKCSIDDFPVVKSTEKRMAYEEVCIEVFNKLEWSFE